MKNLENTLTTLIKYKQALVSFLAAGQAQHQAQLKCQRNIRDIWAREARDSADLHFKAARMEEAAAHANLVMCSEGVPGFNIKLSRLLPHDLATMKGWTLAEFEEIYRKPKTKQNKTGEQIMHNEKESEYEKWLRENQEQTIAYKKALREHDAKTKLNNKRFIYIVLAGLVALVAFYT